MIARHVEEGCAERRQHRLEALPLGPYPGAVETSEQFAGFAACNTPGTLQSYRLDLVTDVDGDETTVSTYDDLCLAGGSAELWTMNEVGHSPDFTPDFAPLVIDWLLSHPKNGDPVNYCTAGVSASGCQALVSGWGIPSASATT